MLPKSGAYSPRSIKLARSAWFRSKIFAERYEYFRSRGALGDLSRGDSLLSVPIVEPMASQSYDTWRLIVRILYALRLSNTQTASD